jgi:hypothetical protein
MLYKEHEAATQWLPEFPGIDVLRRDCGILNTVPMYALPSEWSERRVCTQLSIQHLFIHMFVTIFTCCAFMEQIIKRKIKGSKLNEAQKKEWKKFFKLIKRLPDVPDTLKFEWGIQKYLSMKSEHPVSSEEYVSPGPETNDSELILTHKEFTKRDKIMQKQKRGHAAVDLTALPKKKRASVSYLLSAYLISLTITDLTKGYLFV